MSEIHIPPPPERGQHDKIEIFPHAIADENGTPSQPYRSINILAALQRRRAISDEMAAAGAQFRIEFDRARLCGLVASDIAKPRCGYSASDGLPYRVLRSRERVIEALAAAGGWRSAPGSCLWHVIGLDESLLRWSTQRALNYGKHSQPEATGILKGALSALVEFYGLGAKSG